MRVVDLHCDLLMSLGADSPRGVNDPAMRCSYPQLHQGGVMLQTLAIFTETGKGSHHCLNQQVEAFQRLPSTLFQKTSLDSIAPTEDSIIQVVLAVENASGLLEEGEDFALLASRFAALRRAGPLLYISLTWNDENRFGGGNLTEVGLKEDGVRLLKHLDGCDVAVDMSHTSDQLAEDILNTIDKEGLDIPVIASHSNFRALQNEKRNLPDAIAKEIFRRGGVVGINFIRRFVGQPFEDKLFAHIEYGIKLGGEKQLCFGADFFCDTDVPSSLQHLLPFFDAGYGNATCYPKLIDKITKKWGSAFAENIAYRNFYAFAEGKLAHGVDSRR